LGIRDWGSILSNFMIFLELLGTGPEQDQTVSKNQIVPKNQNFSCPKTKILTTLTEPEPQAEQDQNRSKSVEDPP
jgi:hypothetical protein